MEIVEMCICDGVSISVDGLGRAKRRKQLQIHAHQQGIVESSSIVKFSWSRSVHQLSCLLSGLTARFL